MELVLTAYVGKMEGGLLHFNSLRLGVAVLCLVPDWKQLASSVAQKKQKYHELSVLLFPEQPLCWIFRKSQRPQGKLTSAEEVALFEHT